MGHPLTLVGFMAMYPTQDACRRALLEQRRRERFRCPCEGAGCGDQVSLTAGTPLHKDESRPAQVAAGDLAAAPQEHARHAPRRARAAQRKTLVAVAAEQTRQGGRGGAHLRLIDDAGARTLTKAAGAQIQPGAGYLPRAARRVHAAGRRRAAAAALPRLLGRHRDQRLALRSSCSPRRVACVLLRRSSQIAGSHLHRSVRVLWSSVPAVSDAW